MSERSFTADLHLHTNRSYDSLQSPETVVRYAERAGLDAIAITDHGEFGAHDVIGESTDLMVIPGVEVRTDDLDDLLALFIDSPVESPTFRAAVDEIHSQGGLAILPHPYRKVPSYNPELFELVDAVETQNARSKARNNKAARNLAREHGLPATAGSDAHTPWEIGRAKTVVHDQNIYSQSDLINAIRAGQTEVLGTESPYYFYHGLSVAMEAFNSIQ